MILMLLKLPPPEKIREDKGFRGFTLAEVLVTLGIIGVVSAMTVPSLMQNHQRKTYVTQLHKVYNEIQQVFSLTMTDKNSLNLFEAGLSSNENAYTTLKKYFNIANDCGETPVPCFAGEYKGLDGSVYKPSKGSRCQYTLSLASGAAICFNGLEYKYSYNGVSYPYGFIYVDINGQQGPNIAGRDYFLLYYFNDGSLDEAEATPHCRQYGSCGSASSPQEAREQRSCSGNWPGGCFGKILNDNWEINY